jgi:hypothetical protein
VKRGQDLKLPQVVDRPADGHIIMSNRAHPSDPCNSKLICGHARHASIKVDYVTFMAHATRLATMEEDGLLLANCNACGSTLSIPLAWEIDHFARLRERERVWMPL